MYCDESLKGHPVLAAAARAAQLRAPAIYSHNHSKRAWYAGNRTGALGYPCHLSAEAVMKYKFFADRQL
jgi:hypothetical protein